MVLKIRVATEDAETLNMLLGILKEKYEKVFLTVGTKKNGPVKHLVLDRTGRIEAWEGSIVAGISAWNGEIDGENQRQSEGKEKSPQTSHAVQSKR